MGNEILPRYHIFARYIGVCFKVYSYAAKENNSGMASLPNKEANTILLKLPPFQKKNGIQSIQQNPVVQN